MRRRTPLTTIPYPISSTIPWTTEQRRVHTRPHKRIPLLLLMVIMCGDRPCARPRNTAHRAGVRRGGRAKECERIVGPCDKGVAQGGEGCRGRGDAAWCDGAQGCGRPPEGLGAAAAAAVLGAAVFGGGGLQVVVAWVRGKGVAEAATRGCARGGGRLQSGPLHTTISVIRMRNFRVWI